MTPRAEFLLLVSSFAQAASSKPWEVIQKANQLHAIDLEGLPGSLEQLAFSFVSWQVGQTEQPWWWPSKGAQKSANPLDPKLSLAASSSFDHAEAGK